MPTNKFEESRVVEGTLRNGAQHTGTSPNTSKLNESSAVSRDAREGVTDDAREGVTDDAVREGDTCVLAGGTLSGDRVGKKSDEETFWKKRVTDAGDFTGAEHFPDEQESSSRF